MGSFGVIYSQASFFLSFKVIKAKKAALVDRNTNLHLGFFIDLKLVLYHPVALFKLHFTKNRAGKWKTEILKAKLCPKGQKIEEFPKIS